jgi:ParB family transcriptional regulator, chromosome partitioning protein
LARPDFRAAAARRLSEDRELPPAIVSLLSPDMIRRSTGVKVIETDHIDSNPEQPRLAFDEATLEELAASIREHGVLQPILLRTHPDNPARYELIAGERRWLAAQAAQLHEIPALIKDLGDKEVLEIALVENIQRQDLTPLEEAVAYQRLIAEFGHTQENLGETVGKSRSHVANTLRLLQLPDGVKGLINTGQISAGHARALLSAKDPEAVAMSVVGRGLNVRQTEALVQGEKGEKGAKRGRKARNGADGMAHGAGGSDKSPDTQALENELANLLGLKVEIRERGVSGELVIQYKSLEQLDDVLQRLSRGSL